MDQNWCAQYGSTSPYVGPLCCDARKTSCLSWCSPKDEPQDSLRARSHEVDIPGRNRTRDLICVYISEFFISNFHGGLCVIDGRLWVFRRVRIVAKNDYCFVMSVRPYISPHIPAQLPLDWFPWNMILLAFTKIWWESSNLMEIGQNIGPSTWRSKYVLLLLTTLNPHKSAVFEWSGIRLLW